MKTPKPKKYCDNCGSPRPRHTTEAANNGRKPNPNIPGTFLGDSGTKNFPADARRLCRRCF